MSVIAPPVGHEAREQNLSARRALLRVLTRNPNRIVSHHEVEVEAGRPLSHPSVSMAAKSLGRDMAIRARGGPGGGYALVVPVRASVGEWSETCRSCAYQTPLGHCRELDRETDEAAWCLGWTNAG
jgi:hypothetical protein